MHIQQKITATLIHVTTSFSEMGKLLGSDSVKLRALSLQGDSFIRRAIGKAINA